MTLREKRIAIWGAWYGSRNIGDQAVLISIAQILNRVLGPVGLTVYTDNPEHVHSYAASESGCRIQALKSKAQLPALLRNLASCDLFVIGGGVPFFQQPRHLISMVFLVGAARMFGTPYMIWAVGSQQVTSQVAKWIFNWVLGGAAVITCRDKATCQLFEACGVDREVHLVADPVFALETKQKSLPLSRLDISGDRQPERSLAALIPRSLRGADSTVGVHYQSQTHDDVNRKFSCFAAATDWLWDAGYQPIFIPMNSISPDDDRDAARKIMARAKNGHQSLLVNQEIRPSAVPGILQQCDIVVSARVHGTVNAMIANCPIIMYGFDLKHYGIMESMGLARFVLDAKEANPDLMRRQLAALIADREAVKRQMREQLVELQRKASIPAELARRTVTSCGP